MRIALVNMPFAAADRPSLAIGLLQAMLRRNGFDCTSKHYNILLSRLLGEDDYHQLSDRSSSAVLAGEWVFSQVYHRQSFSTWRDYQRRILSHPVWGIPADEHDVVQRALKAAPQFLRLAFESCVWAEFDVVGFTSTFEQTMASMCLARMIKAAAPKVTIVVGGANFEAGMGAPYLDLFPMIDYVCVGEGEAALVELCQGLVEESNETPAGMISRRRTDVPLPAVQVDLDDLPYPDFDDFVEASRHSGMRYLALSVEASRGCWWGEKSHCTFCGLNGRMMAYRQKSPARVLREVEYLETRYQPDLIQFTDNILSRDHSKSVLVAWAAKPTKTPKFFETKANMTRDELRLLRDAGVMFIQPGIESFSDATLRVMGKGVLAAHNVALLRWGIELGISVGYNIIFGFPKEPLSSYTQMLTLLQELAHLNPPQACSPIRTDRFSPNHARFREQGFTELRPLPSYRHVFPADDRQLEELAYYFEYRHPHSDQLLELGGGLMQFVATWKAADDEGRRGTFVLQPDGPRAWRVSDTRFNRAPSELTLGHDEVVLVLGADRPIGVERLLQFGRSQGVDGRVAAAGLEKLLALGIIRRVGERLVTLPLLPDTVRSAFHGIPTGLNPEATWVLKASSS
jgi:ribosomal peptide maturation radical SAM protein 1